MSSPCHQTWLTPGHTGTHDATSEPVKTPRNVDDRTSRITVPHVAGPTHNPKVAGSNPAPATIEKPFEHGTSGLAGGPVSCSGETICHQFVISSRDPDRSCSAPQTSSGSLRRRRVSVRAPFRERLRPPGSAIPSHPRARSLAPYGNRAEVTVGDATDLNFDSNSFDFACSWLMLHHTIEWRHVISEMARVVRPGGVLAGYDLQTPQPLGWSTAPTDRSIG